MGGKQLVGMLVSLGSPEVAELMAGCGFDWLFIDLEHSTIDFGTAQKMIMAAGDNCACILRVPHNSEVWVKRTLDLGPAGMIIPQVRTAEEALQAVRFAKFPPQGERSVGITRAHGYGMAFQDYIDNANQEISLILQIEHIQAADNIETILKVDGFEAIFIGPYDLSGSLGIPGQINDERVINAVEKVRDRCFQAGVPVGIFAGDSETARKYADEGYSLLAVGLDTILLGSAAQNIVSSLKKGDS